MSDDFSRRLQELAERKRKADEKAKEKDAEAAVRG
jgi:hypothetical protein